jgi:hypothetical protein
MSTSCKSKMTNISPVFFFYQARLGETFKKLINYAKYNKDFMQIKKINETFSDNNLNNLGFKTFRRLLLNEYLLINKYLAPNFRSFLLLLTKKVFYKNKIWNVQFAKRIITKTRISLI